MGKTRKAPFTLADLRGKHHEKMIESIRHPPNLDQPTLVGKGSIDRLYMSDKVTSKISEISPDFSHHGTHMTNTISG